MPPRTGLFSPAIQRTSLRLLWLFLILALVAPVAQAQRVIKSSINLGAKDIIIDHCTVGMDGPHSFHSLR